MRHGRGRLLVFVLCVLAPRLCTGQAGDSELPRIYYPQPLTLWEWQKSIGLTVTTLPQDIVEEELNQSPAIDLHSRLGLPLGFSFDSRVLSQVLTNHIAAGTKWSHSIDGFAFSFGYDIAYWFGFLTVEGFDNSASGWLNYPNVSVGYDFGDFRLALKAEGLIVLGFKTYAGDNVLYSDVNTWGGLSFTLAMEQPFWKNTHVTLAFRVSYLKFYYQSWFTYETFNRYLFIPELSIGFLL